MTIPISLTLYGVAHLLVMFVVIVWTLAHVAFLRGGLVLAASTTILAALATQRLGIAPIFGSIALGFSLILAAVFVTVGLLHAIVRAAQNRHRCRNRS